MSIQAIVERNYFLRRCTSKALVKTVEETWVGSDLDTILHKVFRRLKVVLCNILKGGGGNDLVEENRGVKHYDIKIETIVIIIR